ncbi:LuxR C-terminal-related transcriptional regulator [Paenibacillus nasutitermitis]|uniref:HTH luxR-type domain-containing protein n=1 Tax=Paenibacillus nasutitermitis TaxID=1652958 RepID=A0A916ZFA4_9BACL|nr:LuxR C-terminal-related transcriptional regulator [Paenibacillus nasutitermitis]GGD94064.1 hypothetical protein GCM10010911_60960 [Paenibacillus nasutitermitis]
MISANLLLKTKTSLPPYRENLLLRSRLVEAIARNLDGKLTTVIAPAGFGKTTLLIQTVHYHRLSAGWVSLDERDNDPVRFWRYIIQALIAAGPGRLSKPLSPLAELLPGINIHTFIDALINELAGSPDPLVLVLDDFQCIADARIHESLSYFIEYLPGSVHVILASRSRIPFATSKWRAEEQHIELSIDQLQFTLEETREFYREMSPLPLTARQVGQLFDQTEGWVTGLQLVSISLRSTRDYEHFISSFNGRHRNIADYLFNEVLSHLPSDIHSFLLKTSILERMNAAVCNDVTARTDGQEMLGKLKAMNLFLIPLDDTDTWFRYHHLFSAFLRSLVQRGQPILWSQGQALASPSFMTQGMADEAIHHALLGGDYDYAVQLLGYHAMALFNRGEFPLLLGWFEAAAPSGKLTVNLSLLHAFMLVISGQITRADMVLQQIEERFLAHADDAERRQIQSGMLFVKSNLVFYNHDFKGWYRFSETISGELLPENPIFYNFNYNQGEPLVRRTDFGLKGMLSPHTEAIANQFMGLIESHGWKHSLINLYVNQSLAEGFYEWNRLEDCHACLRKGEQSYRFHEVAGLHIPGRITLARCHAAQGGMELAMDTIQQAIEQAADRSEFRWIRQLRAFLSGLYLRNGQTSLARQEIKRLQLSADDRPAPDRLFEFLALCRYLGAARKEADALRLLALMKPQAEREKCLVSITEISILQALLEAQRGQRLNALLHLREALIIGEANGYIRSFADEGKAMASLLQTYQYERSKDADAPLCRGVSEAYVSRLLDLFTAPRKSRLANETLIEPLTRQELVIIRLMKGGAANKSIAGELSLTEGTVKVYLSRIYAKLGVSSRTQALVRVQELQLLDPPDPPAKL